MAPRRCATCSLPLARWCCGPGSTAGSLRDLQACQRKQRSRWVPQEMAITVVVGGQTPHQWQVIIRCGRMDKNPRHRHPRQHPNLAGRACVLAIAQQRAKRGRPFCSAGARAEEDYHHRRQSLHQCRRHHRLALWGGAAEMRLARSGAVHGRILIGASTEEGQPRYDLRNRLLSPEGTLAITPRRP